MTAVFQRQKLAEKNREMAILKEELESVSAKPWIWRARIYRKAYANR